jgi:hypothetical protein
MVLEISRQGRLVIVIRGQDAQTNSKDYWAQVHSDQMVLKIAWKEVCPCEQRPNSRATLSEDTQMRVGNQLLTARKSN